MLISYKYRLLPTEEQREKLAHFFGCCRFIYNLALELRITAWQSQRVSISEFDLIKQVTQLKHNECKWLNECSAQTLHNSVSNLEAAYRSFFKGFGFPKFKKRSSRQSIQFRQHTKIEGNKFYIPKIGWAEFILHRPIGIGRIKTCTVSKTPIGEYFVSILIDDDNEPPMKQPIVSKTAIGVDLGLKSFAVLSDGAVIENPKYLLKQQVKLRKEQRKLGRKYKVGVKKINQSKGWHKQSFVVAKLHKKITNQRIDFLHKVSTAITKQYDSICLEDLNIGGMIQNRSLSRSISDAGWSAFIRMIEYKAEWYGKNVLKIGRFEPSSKTCSNCGSVFNEMTLDVRMWVCNSCGIEHDRDLNAAKNIKRIGLEAKPSTVNVVH